MWILIIRRVVSAHGHSSRAASDLGATLTLVNTSSCCTTTMSNVETAAQLRSATAAFDSLFANQIGPAKEAFADGDSPFHLLGQGVCAFLEAALGMETGLMAEASRCLTLSEAGARKKSKMAREARGSHRFQPGLEWDILQASQQGRSNHWLLYERKLIRFVRRMQWCY